MPRAEPTPADRAAVADGALTVAGAMVHSGFSRTELFALMRDGTLLWFARGPKKTRFITRASLNELLARLLADHNAKGKGADVRTQRAK